MHFVFADSIGFSTSTLKMTGNSNRIRKDVIEALEINILSQACKLCSCNWLSTHHSLILLLSSGNSDSPLDLSRPDSVLVSSDPKQDHNYSSVALQRCSSRSSSSSLSSLDEGGCDRRQSRRAGSEGFHSDEDSDLCDERGVHQTSRRPPAIKWPAGKRARREVKPELDEELKEAAGSLLHLAGIRSCMEGSKRTVKSTKLNRK